jgi:CHAT domain-containing protein
MISAQAPVVAAVTEAELPSIKEVAALIPPDSAMVEFYFGPGNRLTVFVLNQKGFAAMHTLDMGENDLPGLVEQFRAELKYEVPEEPTGNLLFSILFGPVWDAIAPVGRLFIVPHRELHYLPVAALWFHNSGEGPEHLYLCQRFQICVMPSASYFVHAIKSARKKAPLSVSLVMGNPTQDLEASEAEASAVSKLLGVRPVLGAQATRERVLDLRANHAVIHIASHGIYDERDPLLSGVQLADGRLSVDDLLGSKIPADLLTLSGCLTGISMLEPGDELIGLTRAALAAGAPSVITALWEVGDDPTREFFERFYGNLKKGMDKDSALGLTQHSMLADERYSKPSNWAPFILLGDCR